MSGVPGGKPAAGGEPPGSAEASADSDKPHDDKPHDDRPRESEETSGEPAGEKGPVTGKGPGKEGPGRKGPGWKGPGEREPRRVKPPETIGVVGAGPSGLVTAATLSAAGLPVEILERHTDVGGLWDLDNPGSPIYASAHLISSKPRSAFDGFPFPGEYPDYPSQRQVLAYLRSYADSHGLRELTRFGDAVRRAERLPGGGWQVTCASGTERRYRALVLASGSLWEPNRPGYPGSFTGECMHAKYYRGPEGLRGKRVLVVGGGNSGVDIACDAAAHARYAAISLRRGYHFVPKHIFGVPADMFADRGPHRPARLQQALFERLLRLVVGDLRQFGLPTPDHRVRSSHPVVNTQLLHHLSHGQVQVKPDVAVLDGVGVRFVDDTKEDFDLVIYATGYRPHFPYLDEENFTWHGHRPQLFLNLFHPSHPDLFVVGLFDTGGGSYPLMNMQAKLVARHLLDQQERPEQAAALRKLAATDPVPHTGTRYLDTPRHQIYVQNRAYSHYGRKLLRRMERGRLRVD